MTTYRLRFGRHALRQWKKLDPSIQQQFKKKLAKALENPHNPSTALKGFRNSYRIKLRRVGYRLGYKVVDKQLVVLVISVGRRDKGQIYADFALHYSEWQ